MNTNEVPLIPDIPSEIKLVGPAEFSLEIPELYEIPSQIELIPPLIVNTPVDWGSPPQLSCVVYVSGPEPPEPPKPSKPKVRYLTDDWDY